MPKKRHNGSERERRVVAQEAARIIVNHGMRDYRVAKQKPPSGSASMVAAPCRATPRSRRPSPSTCNFLAAITMLATHARRRRRDGDAREFSPRLVGEGTADQNSAINLHVFADSPEVIAINGMGVTYRP